MRLPNSLFFRTTITLMATSLLLVAITLASIAYFVLSRMPVNQELLGGFIILISAFFLALAHFRHMRKEV